MKDAVLLAADKLFPRLLDVLDILQFMSQRVSSTRSANTIRISATAATVAQLEFVCPHQQSIRLETRSAIDFRDNMC